ncbi:MAG TPA: hypothetical protein PKE45_24255, partial [Caldilineaceae bacterium]|nr:hypothetical protein [Caldilineaceae bacterium]
MDQLLVQFRDPTQLTQLLAPASDATQARLHTLLGAVYEMPFATIHDIRNLQVAQIEFQKPLFPPERLTGTWQQTIPSYTRTDLN